MCQQMELIHAVLSGDTGKFDELLQPHEQSMRNAANRLLRSVNDAEDILQEARMRVFQHLSQFRFQSEFRTWVLRIVINTAFMHLRKNRKEVFDIHPERLEEYADSRSFCFHWERDEEEARSALAARTAVLALPAIYQEVVKLRFLEDVNISETARKLSISIPAVKSRQFRALRILRRKLMTRPAVAA